VTSADSPAREGGPSSRATAPSGLLVIDKPAGMTSHDVVARVRRTLGTRAVGHAGTLDPMATGVLLVLVGEATKLSQFLTLEEKAYAAEVRFGRSTDSLDADGETVEERALPPGGVPREALEQALSEERARTLQVPPAVSAIKVLGVRSHRLARRGEPPALESRAVRVESLVLRAHEADRVTLEVTVSKGYYVRALARDLGARLGVPAHLGALRRTRSGAFTAAEALPLPLPPGAPLLPLVEVARRCLPVRELTEEGSRRATLGQALLPEHFAAEVPPREGPSAWLRPDGALVAVGAYEGDALRVLRGFGPRSAPAPSGP
jgi:tRNA pseudouridine55 synthase